MTDYRNPAIRQLKDQQVRFAPVEKRQEQLDRLERLLAEVEPGRIFPYPYVCYRITDYRTNHYPQLHIESLASAGAGHAVGAQQWAAEGGGAAVAAAALPDR